MTTKSQDIRVILEAAIEIDALRAERDALRAALERIFQHAYDDDSNCESIMDDFDNMRDIARAALNRGDHATR